MKWVRVILRVMFAAILTGCSLDVLPVNAAADTNDSSAQDDKAENEQGGVTNPDVPDGSKPETTDPETTDPETTEPETTEPEGPNENPVPVTKPVFNDIPVADAQSAPRDFTAPALSEFSYTNANIKPAEVISIGHGFEGNGHSVSWDGRFYIVTRTGGWVIQSFRPENIKMKNGLPDFNSGAFSDRKCFENDGNSNYCEGFRNGKFGHNWNAVVRDAAYPENPFRSNETGNADANGNYMTYKAFLFHTEKDANDHEYIGRRSLQVVMANPNSKDAEIDNFKIEEDFTRLTTTNGEFLVCIEPSLTIDGQLLFCNGDRTGGRGINDIAYSFNETSGKTTGWRALTSVANLYADRNEIIDGKPLQVRFPIAQQPMRNAEGDLLSGTDEVNGAYPWISRDGSELFFQGGKGADDANRTATSVVGRWTGWAIRVIDGPINPDRLALRKDEDPGAPDTAEGSRLFISSPGAFTTMWRPFPDVQNLPIPYSAIGAVYPIFGSNTHDYNEVPFNDFVDGNYWVALNMNELWYASEFTKDRKRRPQQYVTDRTPDTSGNFNNASLVGAKFPTEYNGIDTNRGKVGQAIYFPGNSYLEIAEKDSITALTNGFTIEFFIKPMAAFDGARQLTLFAAGDSIKITSDNSGQLSVQLKDDLVDVSVKGPTLQANENWLHIAVTYNALENSVAFFAAGEKINSLQLSENSQWQMARSSIQLGALDSGASNEALFLLDEFKISNLPRSNNAIRLAAFVAPQTQGISDALQARVPSHLTDLLPITHGLNGQWSVAMANLGEDLFNDTLLSQNKTTSCASCHQSALAFTDGVALAVSDESTVVGSLNTPSSLNRLFSTFQGWSGGQPDLLGQSLGPIENPIEMNLSIEAAVNRLNESNYYVDRFAAVFNETPTRDNLAKALAAFQMTLFAPQSLEEQTDLTASQARGKHLFLDKGRCVGCHSGKNFTDESFRNNGIAVNDETLGRMAVTGRLRDKGLIKVPTLRQVAKTAPYMHDGSVLTLRDVVNAYVDASDIQSAVKDGEMLPIELTTDNITDLVNYLETL